MTAPAAILPRVAAAARPGRLCLLYDGQCPLCSREIRILRRLDRRGRLAFEDIAAPTFDPARYGLTMPQVVGAMHAIEPDGTIVTGVEVFRRAYGAVGLGWLLAPTRWPIVRPLADAAYRAFARIRPRLSSFRADASDARTAACDNGRCGVTPGSSPPSSIPTAAATAPGR